MNKKSPDKLLTSLNLDEPCDPSTLRETARALIAARAVLVHFVRESLRRNCPDVDADHVLAEACREFGKYSFRNVPDCPGAGDFLAAITTRPGVLAWDQQIISLDDDQAVKTFSSCPHAEALQALGLSPQEVGHMCRNILMHADFGMVSRHPHLQLSFPEETVAEGGNHCRMVIDRLSSCTQEAERDEQ